MVEDICKSEMVRWILALHWKNEAVGEPFKIVRKGSTDNMISKGLS